MSPSAVSARPDESSFYRIRVRGRVPDEFHEIYGDMSITSCEELRATELAGVLADQTALLSLLSYLDDMGLMLLSAETVDPAP
jgi:hypothetical protein